MTQRFTKFRKIVVNAIFSCVVILLIFVGAVVSANAAEATESVSTKNALQQLEKYVENVRSTRAKYYRSIGEGNGGAYDQYQSALLFSDKIESRLQALDEIKGDYQRLFTQIKLQEVSKQVQAKVDDREDQMLQAVQKIFNEEDLAKIKKNEADARFIFIQSADKLKNCIHLYEDLEKCEAEHEDWLDSREQYQRVIYEIQNIANEKKQEADKKLQEMLQKFGGDKKTSFLRELKPLLLKAGLFSEDSESEMAEDELDKLKDEQDELKKELKELEEGQGKCPSAVVDVELSKSCQKGYAADITVKKSEIEKQEVLISAQQEVVDLLIDKEEIEKEKEETCDEMVGTAKTECEKVYDEKIADEAGNDLEAKGYSSEESEVTLEVTPEGTVAGDAAESLIDTAFIGVMTVAEDAAKVLDSVTEGVDTTLEILGLDDTGTTRAVLDGPGAGRGLDEFEHRYKGNKYESAIGMITGWTNFALPFVSVAAIAVLVYAGFLYITAAGNNEQIEKAKKIIIWVVIGIIIVFSAYALVNTLISGDSST